MTEFFDWLTAVDSGLGTDRLRERFRLSEEEMRRTTEALAPAFVLGLQRLMSDTAAWADFNRRLAAFAPSGTDPASAMTARPAAFMTDLFGTRALADSVSRQASLMAGVSPDTIAKMMPELGLMTLRAMMTMVASGPMSSAAAPGDAAGRATAEWMRRSANAIEAFSRPSSEASPPPRADLQSLFSDALAGGFAWMMPQPRGGGRQPAPPRESGSAPSAPFPFFGFPSFLPPVPENTSPAQPPKAATAETRSPGGAEASAGGPFDGMAKAAEAGRSMQETYAREMMALFDRHRRSD